ncbi:diaminopimelate epimerase [candidate division KSB1 bacterium]|nr:MAG: diaminopimelate epimerase [candidate division KSB1 bacterium]
MKLDFCKYHGLGNDFLLMDDPDGGLLPLLSAAKIRLLCDRHIGIGADGILVRQRSEKADHCMILFNADGSRAEISGNGLRCFVLLLRDKGYDVSRELTIETGGGIQRAALMQDGTVETTMPLPQFREGGTPTPLKLEARGKTFHVLPISVGNPHGVIFGFERDITFAETYGPPLEKHQAFPEGANIEFVHVLSDRACKLVVWERGAGITQACGSGSTATAAAGAALGHFVFDAPIAVHQPGGTLEITVAKDFREIRQRGPATFVFEGHIVL